MWGRRPVSGHWIKNCPQQIYSKRWGWDTDTNSKKDLCYLGNQKKSSPKQKSVGIWMHHMHSCCWKSSASSQLRFQKKSSQIPAEGGKYHRNKGVAWMWCKKALQEGWVSREVVTKSQVCFSEQRNLMGTKCSEQLVGDRNLESWGDT